MTRRPPLIENQSVLFLYSFLNHSTNGTDLYISIRTFRWSIISEKSAICGFLKNKDSSEVILHTLSTKFPNLLVLLDRNKRANESFNNEEIVLLIRVFKVCYLCGTTSNSWGSRSTCGCISHFSNCPSARIRRDHCQLNCTNDFRAKTLQMFLQSLKDGNFSEFFQSFMTNNYPTLMKAVVSKLQNADPTTQIKELQHDLDRANQANCQMKNENEALRLLNEELEKNLESTKKQFEWANMRLAVITDEINNLRRQSDAARNELPVEEQKAKQLKTDEIDASDRSLLKLEWKKFEEKFAALQEKTELLAQQTITRRSAAVMRANNPKILKASETADEVKNSVIETLRTETNRIVDTEEELFPHLPSQTFSASDSHINDVNLLD